MTCDKCGKEYNPGIQYAVCPHRVSEGDTPKPEVRAKNAAGTHGGQNGEGESPYILIHDQAVNMPSGAALPGWAVWILATLHRMQENEDLHDAALMLDVQGSPFLLTIKRGELGAPPT